MLELQTERFTIRDLTIDDLENQHKLMSDSIVMNYIQDIKKDTIEESKENLMMAINDIGSKNRKYYFFLIEEKTTKEFIGNIGYTVKQNTPYGKIVELGFFIEEKHWNKGYTTEAVKRVLKFAFEEGDVYRITTGCAKENAASERVMQKNGFIKEAEYKEIFLHDGKLKDRVEYRMLKYEWLRI